MTTKELIEKLQLMPQDADVYHLWDGELRTEINVVYLSRAGDVVTADYDQVCYTDDNRPMGAPTEKEDKFWETPSNPNE